MLCRKKAVVEKGIFPSFRYSNGNVYAGNWSDGKRNGFGRLEEASRKNSVYCGGYINDKKCGYGIYDDRMK